MAESEASTRSGRNTRKPPSRKGIKATPAQKAALAAGRAARDDAAVARKERKAKGLPASAKDRLNLLVSGELSVSDLDDDELERGRVHDGNGSFKGKSPRMPPRIQDAMYAENIRRTNRVFQRNGMRAAKRMKEIMTEEGADATQLRAAMAIVDRVAGKTPEIVHVGQETEFDRLRQGTFEFDRSELNNDEE